MACNRAGESAIVIGGSMSGLLAAGVLSDYFGQVVIVERDWFPLGPENRRGVPQGAHTHSLLASERQILETLFPGISAQLVEDGAIRADIVRDARWFLEGGCHSRPASQLQRVDGQPSIPQACRDRAGTALAQCGVSGEVHRHRLDSIARQDTRYRVAIGEERLAASLVVDTSGRGSHSPPWLQGMGYPKPTEEGVEIALSYSARFFRRETATDVRDLAVIVPPTPTGKRGGVMLAQEGGRWTVTLISHFGPSPPRELGGFIEFARTLPAQFIYEAIRQAEPLGEAVTTRFPASVRRRYEKLNCVPEGYLVMGDAVSSFNPIYGQGMSVAALEAMELRGAFAGFRNGLSRRFYERAAKVIDTPWSIAVGNELRMAEAKGPCSFATRLTNAYISKLHQAAHNDPAVALAFHEVGNLIAPPQSLLHPRIACRVLWNGVRTSRKQSRELSDSNKRLKNWRQYDRN